jgi:hypothetical protein
MITLCIGEYSVICHSPGLPDLYDEYLKRATIADQFDLGNSAGTSAFLAVGKPNQWPFMVVAQRRIPREDASFHPGALLVPETDMLFVGGGERLLAYDLTVPCRQWMDNADTGFLSWDRSNDVVLMSAELEFAAWDTRGNKLWSMFVEPPWSYAIRNGRILLDIMGNKKDFELRAGPVM